MTTITGTPTTTAPTADDIAIPGLADRMRKRTAKSKVGARVAGTIARMSDHDILDACPAVWRYDLRDLCRDYPRGSDDPNVWRAYERRVADALPAKALREWGDRIIGAAAKS